jgi:hypothetical protein
VRHLPFLAVVAVAASTADGWALSKDKANLRLMDQAYAAGEAVMKRYEADPRFEKFDLDMARIQQARLKTLFQCKEGLTFFEARQELRAEALVATLNTVRDFEGPECRRRLARLALQRIEDPAFTPIGRVSVAFELGAELRSLSDAEGQATMDRARDALAKAGEWDRLAKARFQSLRFFQGPDEENSLFEEAAADLKKPLVFDSTRNGFLVIFAGKQRCDLVEKVAGKGRCPDYFQRYQSMYVSPDPNSFKWLQRATSDLGFEKITPDEAGLKFAKGSNFPMGYLVLFARKIRERLGPSPSPSLSDKSLVQQPTEELRK